MTWWAWLIIGLVAVAIIAWYAWVVAHDLKYLIDPWVDDDAG